MRPLPPGLRASGPGFRDACLGPAPRQKRPQASGDDTPPVAPKRRILPYEAPISGDDPPPPADEPPVSAYEPRSRPTSRTSSLQHARVVTRHAGLRTADGGPQPRRGPAYDQDAGTRGGRAGFRRKRCPLRARHLLSTPPRRPTTNRSTSIRSYDATAPDAVDAPTPKPAYGTHLRTRAPHVPPAAGSRASSLASRASRSALMNRLHRRPGHATSRRQRIARAGHAETGPEALDRGAGGSDSRATAETAP